MMKYPKTIDTLLYKRIDKSTYHVKNGITGVVYEIGTDIVRFMNKLDGKTDPFMINTCLSDFEIEEVLDFLWANELVTKKKWKKIGFLTYGIPLFKVKTTQKMRIVSRLLNILLMISFVPIFIVGLYAVKDIYNMVDQSDFSYLIGLCVGTAVEHCNDGKNIGTGSFWSCITVRICLFCTFNKRGGEFLDVCPLYNYFITFKHQNNSNALSYFL